MLAVAANWTHFDRVGVVSAANGDQSLVQYQDLRSFDDFKASLQAVVQMSPTFPDLDKSVSLFLPKKVVFRALRFVNNSYPLEEGMTSRDVVFFTASTDTPEISRAQNSADSLKTLGRLITVGIGITDVSILAPISSTNSAVSFTDFTDFTETAAQINQLLL